MKMSHDMQRILLFNSNKFIDLQRILLFNSNKFIDLQVQLKFDAVILLVFK